MKQAYNYMDQLSFLKQWQPQQISKHCIIGNIREKSWKLATFFAIAHKKTFTIQPISYIKN